MPNWCQTNITINHEDEEKLKELDQLLTEWTKKDYMKNDFGHNWLGNIVLGSQIGTVDTGTETDLRCRGTVSDIEVHDGQLVINTETAWSPMLEMWLKLRDKYIPDAEVIYSAEECGCGLYSTNDPTLIGKYIFDAWDIDDFESYWECQEELLIKDLQQLLKTEESDIKKLLSLFKNSEYSECASIHQWEFCPTEVFD